MVLDAGDVYLALLLFWGCFLPWEKAFSLDCRGSTPEVTEVRSPATCAFTLQVCLLYWLSAIPRTGTEWRVEASALYYVANSGSTAVAQWLLRLGEPLLALLTTATLWLEEIGPFLILLPFPRLRLAALLAFMSFHIGVEFTLRLGVFSLVCVAAPLGLFPAFVWDSALGRRFCDVVAGGFRRLSRGRPPASCGHVGLKDKILSFLPIPALALMLLYVTCDLYRLPLWGPADRAVKALGLKQRWSMYSPRPSAEIGQHRVEGTTRSGQRVELISAQPWPTDSEPPAPNPWLDYRWYKFRVQLRLLGFDVVVSPYLNFLVMQWNRLHPEDPIVAARYLYRARTVLRGYRLGPERVDVKGVYLP